MTAIASNAFVSCSGLFEVELPPSIETIGPSAFGQNEALTAVTLPESLTEMGVGAFDAANNLRSIRIPSAVTEMGVGVFHNCKHLGDVFFAEPARLKRLPKNAFQGTALQSVRLPSSVVEVHANAFGECASLRHVVVGSPDLVFDEAAFGTSALTHDLTCERACPRGQETVPNAPAPEWNASLGLPDSCRRVSLQHAECRTKAGGENGPGEIIVGLAAIAAGLTAMAAGFLLCRAVIVRKSGASGDVRRGNGDAESTRLIGLEGGVRGGDDVGGDGDGDDDDERAGGGFLCFPCQRGVEMTSVNVDASMLLGPAGERGEADAGGSDGVDGRAAVGAPKSRSDSYESVHVV
jgi:hypothetical protein